MRLAILVFMIFVAGPSANAWDCNDTQSGQGCYADKSDGSSGEVSWRCMIRDDSDRSYICPYCEPHQTVKIEIVCKTVMRKSCNPMIGCDQFPETVCSSSPVCR